MRGEERKAEEREWGALTRCENEFRVFHTLARGLLLMKLFMQNVHFIASAGLQQKQENCWHYGEESSLGCHVFGPNDIDEAFDAHRRLSLNHETRREKLGLEIVVVRDVLCLRNAIAVDQICNEKSFCGWDALKICIS